MDKEGVLVFALPEELGRARSVDEEWAGVHGSSSSRARSWALDSMDRNAENTKHKHKQQL
jgi:hypothetical protein